jgi:dienelactone hydrolase
VTLRLLLREAQVHEFFPSSYRWSYNTLLAFAAGGQLGDLALILPRLLAPGADDETWHREWAWLGTVLERRAQAARSRDSACDNYLLASLYHTISEHFIPPTDPRRMQAYREVLRTFDEARKNSSHPIERVHVPYQGASLPAYFVPAATAGARPAVIFLCGLDTTKELWFLRARMQLAVRGMHALFIDTPGIGEALRVGGLVTRYDYEKPVAAAIDWLETRPEVVRERIAIVGSSLGGYYVARAAAFEPRLRAAVAWGVIYDYHEVWVRRMTSGGAVAAPKFQLMFVTGTDSMEAAMERIKEFRVAAIGPRVTCPFLVMHGAEDRQVPEGHAEAMFQAIGSRDKEMVVFDGENGGAAHCQFDNHLPALQICTDWLARKLDA